MPMPQNKFNELLNKVKQFELTLILNGSDLIQLDDEEWTQLNNALSLNNNILSIKLTNLSSLQENENAWDKLARSMASLTSVDIISLEGNNLIEFSELQCSKLNAILTASNRLKLLDLSNTNLGRDIGTNEALTYQLSSKSPAVVKVFKIFKNCKALSHLNLSKNSLWKWGTVSWKEFGTALQLLDCSELSIDLRNNQLGVIEPKQFKETIGSGLTCCNNKLKEIDLIGNLSDKKEKAIQQIHNLKVGLFGNSTPNSPVLLLIGKNPTNNVSDLNLLQGHLGLEGFFCIKSAEDENEEENLEEQASNAFGNRRKSLIQMNNSSSNLSEDADGRSHFSVFDSLFGKTHSSSKEASPQPATITPPDDNNIFYKIEKRFTGIEILGGHRKAQFEEFVRLLIALRSRAEGTTAVEIVNSLAPHTKKAPLPYVAGKYGDFRNKLRTNFGNTQQIEQDFIRYNLWLTEHENQAVKPFFTKYTTYEIIEKIKTFNDNMQTQKLATNLSVSTHTHFYHK